MCVCVCVHCDNHHHTAAVQSLITAAAPSSSALLLLKKVFKRKKAKKKGNTNQFRQGPVVFNKPGTSVSGAEEEEERKWKAKPPFKMTFNRKEIY